MKISDAIDALEGGQTATRESWGVKGAHIFLADEVIQWKSDDHPAQAFIPNSDDLRADDWEIIE